MEDTRLYTLKEVSEILHVTRRSLYNYIQSGKLAAVKAGGTWRVTEGALNDFLEGAKK